MIRQAGVEVEPEMPTDTVWSFDQRRNPVGHRVVKRGAILTGDLDEVLEAGVGDENGAGALPLEQGVGGDGGSMEEVGGPGTWSYGIGSLPHSPALIWGGRHFRSAEVRPVPTNDVSERPTDVDRNRQERALCVLATWKDVRDVGVGDKKQEMITVSATPNPNAAKFSVGREVGATATFVPGKTGGDPMAEALLALPGVTSVFMTADFVTISKNAETDWDDIVPGAQAILEEHFS